MNPDEQSATLKSMLGPTPQCKANERDKAQAYCDRIDAAIKHGGWTPTTRARLYNMRRKWRSRASGEDVHFRLVGNAPGRHPYRDPATVA